MEAVIYCFRQEELEGYRSINITRDWRVLYSEKEGKGENIVIFEMVGTHSQLYR